MSYQSKWQTELDDAIDKILNRKEFSYDVNGDALYQQYKDKYMEQGKLAMQDTIGKASAMTGGYGNSYATTAGSQAYQSHLNNLSDVIPELYQLAYNKYSQEGQDLYDKYTMLGEQDNADYKKYLDHKQFEYQTQRDQIADAKWQSDYDLKQSELNLDRQKYEDAKKKEEENNASEKEEPSDTASENRLKPIEQMAEIIKNKNKSNTFLAQYLFGLVNGGMITKTEADTLFEKYKKA